MKIIYAGTPSFAQPALEALIRAEYHIVAVLTQPDRPQGRGRHIEASPIKKIALQHHIPIEQPLNFKEEASLTRLKKYEADLMLVAAYGLILPVLLLESFKYGCINIHASILPRWRGAAPIQRAIIAGDVETGISIMQMEKGLDTGPYFAIAKCPIHNNDTTQTLHDRLAELGAETLLKYLPDIIHKRITATPQNHPLATYAHKIEKSEARIHWEEPAELIHRKIRAFNPWPVAYCDAKGITLRIWQAEFQTNVNTLHKPGTILSASHQGIIMTCGSKGEDSLMITSLQLPGGKILRVSDVLNAHKDLFLPGNTLS